MLEKASMMDCNSAVKSLKAQELGFLLLSADKGSIYDILAKKSSFKDRQGMYGSEEHIVYHLYPLLYRKHNGNITKELTKCRANAIYNIFNRWTACGYNKHHAKDPFASKAFNKYLDDIEFNKADYMLLQVQQ